MVRRNINFSPPDIKETEINEVIDTLRSGWITTGPRTKTLERRLAAFIETGKTNIDVSDNSYVNRVACLNSATAAEELNLRILGIKPGDEVVVPAYTYTASASSAIHCGAKVVFVDILKNGNATNHMPEIDYQAFEKAITSNTKAIVVVDFGGVVADYDKIYEVVKRKKHLFTPVVSDGSMLGDLSSRIQNAIGRIAVVADCAHSLGADRKVCHVGNTVLMNPEWRNSGSIADFSSFSFHAVKNFTTAEGGASTWLPIKGIKDSEIYQMYQFLSLHGQSKDALSKTNAGLWEYDIIGPWYKYNMTDVLAALGLRQLDRYPELLNRRKQIVRKYDDMCDELGIEHLIHHTDDMNSSNHLYIIRIPEFDEEKRNLAIIEMAKHGVSTNVHYKPLPMMTAYRSLGWYIADFPHAYSYYQNLITLPLHTLLSDEDVGYICETTKLVISQIRGLK